MYLAFDFLFAILFMGNNTVSRQIESLLAFKDSNAANFGCTQANISQKFKRDNFSEKEMQEIANTLIVT